MKKETTCCLLLSLGAQQPNLLHEPPVESNAGDQGAHFSCKGVPSRSASESVNSCAAGKSAASENPRDGLLMKSLTLRGACSLLPVLLMAHELSLTAAAACDHIRY